MGNNSSNETLESKMERLKVEKITTGQTFGADQVLFEQVMMKLNEKGMKKKKHFIVFCPIMCCVGSDVKAAMETVKRRINNDKPKEDTTQDDQGIILVLMHHTRDPDYSTAGINYCETISDVDLNVHVLFHETMQGLLKCSQNEKAVREIVDFLRQEPPKKQNLAKSAASQSPEDTKDNPVGQNSEETKDNPAGQNSEETKDNLAGRNSEETKDNPAGQNSEETKDNLAGQNSEETKDNLAGQNSEETKDNPAGQNSEETKDNPAGQNSEETKDNPAGQNSEETKDNPAWSKSRRDKR